AAGCASAPHDMTVHGTVRVVDDPVSSPSPIHDGDQVTITDPAGKVIAFTTLNGNADQGPALTLTFGFVVKVPEGDSSYGVHVSGLSGTTQFTQAEMEKGPAICAGDACG